MSTLLITGGAGFIGSNLVHYALVHYALAHTPDRLLTLCGTLNRLRPLPGSNSSLKTFVPDRPGHDRRYAIDATKIRHELGWAYRRTFEAGLETTFRWYPDHRKWCDDVQAGRYTRERLGLVSSGSP